MGAECERHSGSRTASLLMLLMLFTALSPLAGIRLDAADSAYDLQPTEIRANSVSLNSGYGEALAGTSTTINATDWTFEARRGLDEWLTTNINLSGTPSPQLDLTRDDRGRARGCVQIPGVGLYAVNLEFGGGTSATLVEAEAGVGNQLGGACSIAIDEREMSHIAYVDENQHLSIGRQIYDMSWNVRTIEDSIPVSDPVKLLLRSTPEAMSGAEVILYRHSSDHTLHMSSFTTTYWEHTQLLPGQRIGSDFDAYLDSDDNLHLLYIDLDSSELRTARWNGSSGPDETVIDNGASIGPAVSFALSPATGTEQFAYANGTNSLRIVRDLAGQEKGRLNTSPTELNSGTKDIANSSAAFNTADLNCDGTSDLVVSEPARNGTTGAVHVWYGSSAGITSTPSQTLWGSAGGDRFGHSTVDAGDVNGDGCSDLAVSAPGETNSNSLASGVAYVFHGKSGGLDPTPSWSWEGAGNGDKMGGSLASAGDVNNDGYDDLLVAATGIQLGSRIGWVYLFEGSSMGLNATTQAWAKQGSGANVVLGFTMAGVGDANNDGYDDVAIASTGDFADLVGYCRVQVYHGSASGLSTSYAREWPMNQQGTLFGRSMSGLGDINNDGYDDLAIGEPFNQTSAGASSGGKVWIFTGSATGYSKSPNKVLEGENTAQWFGSAIAPVGDINDDGSPDVLISSLEYGSQAGGRVNLFFSDASQLLRAGTDSLLITGSPGQHIGRSLSGGGDVDEDGQLELLITSTDRNLRGDSASSVLQFEKRNFERLDEPRSATSVDIGLDDQGRMHLLVNDGTDSTHLERPNQASNPSEPWREHTQVGAATSSMVVTRAGKAVILAYDGDLEFHEQAGHNLLTTSQYSSVNDIPFVQLEVIDERSHILYAESANATHTYVRLLSENGTNGFTSQTINTSEGYRSGTTLGGEENWWEASPNGTHQGADWVLFSNSSNSSAIATDMVGGPLTLSSEGATWVDGCTFSNETMVSVEAHSDRIALTWYSDYSTENLTSFSAAHLQADCMDDGSLVLAAQALNGSGLLLNHLNDTTTVLASHTGSISGFTGVAANQTARAILFSDGTSASALFADSSASGADATLCDDQGVCESVSVGWTQITEADGSQAADGSRWLVYAGANSIPTLARFTPPNSAGAVATFDTVWEHMPTSSTQLRMASATTDDAGVVRIALAERDGSVFRIISVRLHNDWDRDFVPDPWDDVAFVGGQWNDGDGDGYGDNPDGAAADRCTSNSGTSKRGYFGCADADGDGFAEAGGVDDCAWGGSSARGYSFVDRQGCVDTDGDGWSANIPPWADGDLADDNEWQARDADGDGRMNNHGPDCCGSSGYSDIFPFNGNQWEDLDNDGWGDESRYINGNESSRNGSIDWTGDQCIGVQGFSQYDRGGCPDDDGDGWSDPESDGSWEYNRSQCHGAGSDGRNGCADRWANDTSQWHDRDGDGYGDNYTFTLNAGTNLRNQNGDAFVDDSTQWSDFDGDGLGDNPNGTLPDDCPLAWGNSSADRQACPDSDGDGWSDPDANELAHPDGNADSNASNPEQWRDTDGDGFGDFPELTNGDQCPLEFGYLNGELGRGCPLPANDSDGDNIIDEEDMCNDTAPGETVDTSGPYKGCSENQKDDDGDGVPNSNDQCANTTAPPSEVNAVGCSEDQETQDSDQDGVNDLNDTCPNTALGASVDADGCAAYQLDSDGDGVFDHEDICPGTSQGAQVDEQGCPRGDVDTDEDGYPDNEDAFPDEASQWGDYDGDGYGDEPPPAFEGDACPSVAGNSTVDRFGCEDSDGDGYSDPQPGYTSALGADAFPTDSTQWSDVDGDEFGDNPDGANPDACPTEAGVLDGVRGDGCPAATDATGNVTDDCTKYEDNFGPDSGYPGEIPGNLKHCSWAQTDSADEGISTTMIIGGVVGGFVLLLFATMLVIMIRRRGDDYDDEDDMFDIYEEEDDYAPRTRGGGGGAAGGGRGGGAAGGGRGGIDDLLGQSYSRPSGSSGRPDVQPGGFGIARGAAGPSRGGPGAGGPGGPSGPGRAGPGGGRGQARAGPPSRGSSSPPGRGPGLSSTAPPGPARRTKRAEPEKAKSTKKVARKVASDEQKSPSESTPRKVKKTASTAQKPTRRTKTAKQKPATQQFSKRAEKSGDASWEDLFTGRDEPGYNESLDKARQMLADEKAERLVLRQLQEDGWTSRQSRWILDAAQMR